jgi:serine/threonine protein kinase
MGRKEVLKVVGSHVINSRGVLDRFLGEIRHAAQLHHPNIVTAYAALRMGESLVLAMEYVEGLDLAKLVKARGPLPVANACYYVHQAALGLQHAHEHGMVHRDIKPSNLMLARQGNRAVVKVLDFGLAKVSREVPADGTLTYEGQMLGTPDFIAPEQSVDARSADIRADIYSLGCTLYYLLTGRPPFQGTSLYDVLQAHHSREALPLNLARPEVPVELAALVAKMMAKEPERRFQEPKEVAQALTPFFKKGTVASVGSKPDLSQVGQPEAKQGRTSAVSAPTRPATEIAPAPAARKPSEPTRPGSILEGLIDLRETEPLFDPVLGTPLPVAASRASRRNLRPSSTAFEKLSRSGPRAWWAAAGLLLLGFVVAWVVVLWVRTSNGTIELVNLPRDAEVLVDGEEVAVTWPGGG